MATGIYTISNTVNKKQYVGSSFNIEKRWKRHLKDLQNGTHHNCKLQAEFSVLGEDCFYLSIIELCADGLKEKEDSWIKRLNTKTDGYNIGDAVFGDTLTHHPDRLIRIAKMTKTLNESIANMPETERKDLWGRVGEENPNYNETLVRECASCGKSLSRSTIARRGKTCGECRDRTGDKNPFFGNKHSEVTKEKIRAARQGNRNSASRVYAEGMIFEACVDCAKHFGISAGLVTYRVKSPKYPSWYKE